MLNILSAVIRNIAVLIILVTILEMLLPRKDLQPFVNMAVGIILILFLLAPLRLLDPLQPNPALHLFFPDATDSYYDEEYTAAILGEIEQVKQELTVSRYKDLLADKIAGILLAEGYEVTGLTLEVEENLNKDEAGMLREVNVLAKKLPETGEKAGPVAEVEIRVQGPQKKAHENRRDPVLERCLAKELAVSREIVVVRLEEQ